VSSSPFTLGRKQMQFPKRRVFYSLEYRTMNKVENPSNSVCYTLSSEPFRIYLPYASLRLSVGHLPSPSFISFCYLHPITLFFIHIISVSAFLATFPISCVSFYMAFRCHRLAWIRPQPRLWFSSLLYGRITFSLVQFKMLPRRGKQHVPPKQM
jgi:hypothetical protein